MREIERGPIYTSLNMVSIENWNAVKSEMHDHKLLKPELR